ncbi:DUF2971 domain-containing protein [Chryseobacterium formosus]|uniref:DUF2971 domain-containing protein n=1 Tax=Chryseobacterium formosus TaxID=1537363 RepID=A0ABT3XSS0_9FLAO|nr:DUF2971 domain-containing protein [Chryseobacterium formosus]MCX8524671.1 DUF2971 domain-containing protein [Chryseobacterium formosus]
MVNNTSIRKILYKYRSLDNFDLFLDILINKRLYATKYSLMNDPMEGLFLFENGTIQSAVRKKIYNEKNDLKICCLSENEDSMLMWSHYSNSHKGVILEVEVSDLNYDIVNVKYENNLSTYNADVSAKTILSSKLIHWEYEKEVRIFQKNDQNKYINVEIKRIILGRRISELHKILIQKLVLKIDRNIIVSEIPYEDFEYLKF